VAVGDSGTILTANDSSRWVRCTTGTTQTLRSVVYGNNKYVTVGYYGIILTSPVVSGVSYSAPKLNYSVTGQTMQIYTLQGKLISQRKIETENGFDGKSGLYKNLSKGMYIVRVPTDNTVISRRVLVE
jgi:hypothetical protein